jgi:hypothetical protein
MIQIGKLTFMWKTDDSRTGNCPGLHRVEDGPSGYVVVGKTIDPSVRALIAEIDDDETAVWVPANVLDRLKDS